MKKLFKILMPVFILLLIFSSENLSYGFSYIKPSPNKVDNLALKSLTAREFIKLSADDFNVLTGKKLNVFQRVFFTISKMRVKHDLKKNSALKITDYLDKDKKGNSFNFTWFLLGLAGPLIGILTGIAVLFVILSVAPVVVAYATKQDKIKKKSVWAGFSVGILISLIIAVISLTVLAV